MHGKFLGKVGAAVRSRSKKAVVGGDKIDLQYINASWMTKLLASPKLSMKEIVDEIEGMISEDLNTARSYISKYDNWVDKSEGTDVSDFNSEIDRIEAVLTKLKAMHL